MSIGRMMEIATGASPTPTWAPAEPTAADLIRRIAKAEALLSRIRHARGDFSRDAGGPAIGVESHQVVEGWIDRYYDGSYYGDLEVEPTDPVLRRLLADVTRDR